MTTLYDILGVDETADQRDIRKAYLKKVVSEHPDKGGSSSSFDRLQNAYNILSDPHERSAYDEKRSGQRDARGGQEEGFRGPDATYYTEKDGIRVQHHGQTRLSVRPRRKREACAGQGQERGVEFGRAIEEWKREYHQNPTDPVRTKNLAMAYIDRSRYHADCGRHHHAVFDAQEAEHVSPGILAEMSQASDPNEPRWVALLSRLCGGSQAAELSENSLIDSSDSSLIDSDMSD